MYQSSQPVVALTPAQPLPANRFFHLWINGGSPSSGGVEDVGDNMLAGDGSTPGTSYTAMLARGTSLKYCTPAGDQVSLKITGGGIIDDLLERLGSGHQALGGRRGSAPHGPLGQRPEGSRGHWPGLSRSTRSGDWATSAMSG